LVYGELRRIEDDQDTSGDGIDSSLPHARCVRQTLGNQGCTFRSTLQIGHVPADAAGHN